MIKRYKPIELPSTNQFEMPSDWDGTEVNVFVNGALYSAENDTTHPFGYFIVDNVLGFFNPLTDVDELYLMYEDGNASIIDFNNVDWSKTVRVTDFAVEKKTITWEYKSKSVTWSHKSKQMVWGEKKQKELFSLKPKQIVFKTKIV